MGERDDRYVQDGRSLTVTIEHGVDTSIQFAKQPDGSLEIEIDEPWAGSTETGFGATTHATLTKADVGRLLVWLMTAKGEAPGT